MGATVVVAVVIVAVVIVAVSVVAVSVGIGVPTTVAVAVAVTDGVTTMAVVVIDAGTVVVIAAGVVIVGEGCVDVIDADAVVPERTVATGVAGIAVPVWVAVMAVMDITGVGDAATVAVIAADRGGARWPSRVSERCGLDEAFLAGVTPPFPTGTIERAAATPTPDNSMQTQTMSHPTVIARMRSTMTTPISPPDVLTPRAGR